MEEHVVRAGFQRALDDLFPRGAWVTVLMGVGERLVPTGIELAVGRLFCSDAVLGDGGWLMEVFVDPRTAEDDVAGVYVQPFRFWMTEFNHDNDDLYLEARAENAVGDLMVVRMVPDPKAKERKPPKGHREFITALREKEFFPEGLEAA